MSSNLKVNSLVPATGTAIGIGTTGGSIDFRCPATFGGNVTIGGTLTYDEVINIDSIGIVTARSGLKVTGGQLDVGSNIKLGNAGVVTATSFIGDGSGLTGIAGTEHVRTATLTVSGVSTFTGMINSHVHIPDAVASNDYASLYLGTGNDVRLFHNGQHSFWQHKLGTPNNGGNLYIDSYTTTYMRTSDGSNNVENAIIMNGNDSVEIYHSGSKKLETTSSGITVTGNATATTFIGALTGTASGNPTLTNGSNDRIVTASGANALNGEANLQFDGTNLFIPNELRHLGDPDTKIGFDTDTIKLFTAGTQKFRIYDDGVVSIGQSTKSSTVGVGGLDIQGNGTNCIIEMGNPFPGFSGGVVPEFRITATNSSHEVKFESVWGGDNLLHPHIAFTGGRTHFYRGTNSDEIARFDSDKFGINETSPDTKLHITHSNATEDVIKLEASPVTAATGERSRIIFNVTQSNGQAAKLGHIASHTLNGWGGELAFHTKPANGTPNNSTNEVMRLHANGCVSRQYHPAFMAHRNGASHIVMSSNSGLDVIFTSEEFDNGSNYNTSNGRFTCPVAGKYYFGIQLYTGFNGAGVRVMHASWRKNGGHVGDCDLFGGISNHGGTHYHPTTVAHTILECAANDYVTFRLGNMGYTGGDTWLYGSKGTRFFGHLVA